MKLSVYSKSTLQIVGMIKEYTYITYTQQLRSRGSFEIRMPITEESLEVLTFGNYINFERGVLGIVKGRRDSEDSDTEVIIYGYLSNHLLEYRSFLVTAKYYDYINKIAYDMLYDLFMNPTPLTRKIPLVSRSPYGANIGQKVRVQNTGDTLLKVLYFILDPYDLGFNMMPYYTGEGLLGSLEFQLIRPVDRTIGNEQGNIPVVFSFDLNNLERLEHEIDGRQYCNVAIVAGEGEGTERTIVEVGDTSATGIDRIELYVDARDLQSGVSEEWVEDYVDDQFGELINGQY